MGMMRILTSLVATTMFVGLVLAVDHDVGSPNGGWDTSTDLGSWASSETFTQGDNIVFNYLPNHNVLEVSEADYDSCSTGSPISTDALTPTTIALTAAGSRYFICGTPGHCSQGMKVEIKTVAATSPAPPTTTTPPSATPPTTTPPSATPPTTTSPPSSTPPVSTTSPPSPSSSSSDTPSPPNSTPDQSTPDPPSPSSAETVKVGAAAMMGFGVLMMI